MRLRGGCHIFAIAIVDRTTLIRTAPPILRIRLERTYGDISARLLGRLFELIQMLIVLRIH